MKLALRIRDNDNVATALQELAKGERLEEFSLQMVNDIPAGHKFAIRPIAKGGKITKYGLPIGSASRDIKMGEWVHSHNTETNLSVQTEFPSYRHENETMQTAIVYPEREFWGYRRVNGCAGLRNELWIIPLVGCVNGTADRIAEQFRNSCPSPSADDIVVLRHAYGCSQTGDDLLNTQKILTGLAKHPNAGGVLLLGLGCENNTMQSFEAQLGEYDTSRIRFLIAQETDDEVERGAEILHELDRLMRTDQKEKQPLSALKIGLKCGGSDGFSGITANPLLGLFSDTMAACGASVVMSEVPEMFGAETLLFNRAENELVFYEMLDMIRSFKDYFVEHNQPVSDNPSPGNHEGGITTLEEKSLGCTQKAGLSPIRRFLTYGGRVQSPGLSLLKAPGNDLVSCTALAAAGCQLILFTTGRGTPFGTVIPTVKISTNSELFSQKRHWIDFDAGRVLHDQTPESLLGELTAFVKEVIDGEATANERNRFKEIALWKNGVTL